MTRAAPRRAALAAAALPALAVALAAAALPACRGGRAFAPPELTWRGASVSAVDFDGVTVALRFDVRNPNRLGARLDGYALRFTVDEVVVVDERVARELDLRGGRTASLEIPARVRWADVASRLARGRERGDLPWDARGKALVDTPFGAIAVPFRRRGTLPVVEPPRIAPADLRVLGLSPRGAELALTLAVDNPNARPVDVHALRFAVRAVGVPVAEAALAAPLHVGARDRAVQDVRLAVGAAGLARGLAEALAGRRPLEVTVSGTGEVDTGFGRAPLAFDVSRTLAPGR